MQINDSHSLGHHSAYIEHPIDNIEPEHEEVTERAISLNSIVDYLLREVINARNPRAKSWQVAYCINSIICQNSIKHTCSKVGVSKEYFINGCVKVIKDLELKPSINLISNGETGAVHSIFESYKVMRFINSCLQWLINAQSPQIAAYQIAYAIGSPLCDKSMTEQGRALGVGHATISKGARDFIEINNLTPSKYMKSENFANQRSDYMKNL